ncbi:MAG: COX15/CtaA family protein [Rhodoferax sp.]|nr:COX15/CtaA family protein [Rhodoferax sp.]
MHANLYDFSPTLRLLVLGVLVASGPLLLVYLRNIKSSPLGRMHSLAVVTLFLTFDLVLFGAFTRLTDSGLGCPDWPGCYGSASPLGAGEEIANAQRAMPTGPVTRGKAWVEMVHRYLATAVGVLITVMAVAAWLGRKAAGGGSALLPGWATLTWVWVCIQGAFGALTVTMKLFPLIVTLHLLGGYILLALLTVQVAMLGKRQGAGAQPLILPVHLRGWLLAAVGLLLLQAASGAWVSTNYAVLACTDFPQCQGSWWPAMDFAQAFTVWRPLGLNPDGSHISFQALTAIHLTHRGLALVTLLALAALAWHLSTYSTLTRAARLLGSLLVLQALTGISNAVLEWPLLAAVLHTGGAGAMVMVLVWLLASVSFQSATDWALAFAGRLNQ